MRAKGKSIMSGSQNRLNRNGSIASSVSGPPSWKRTTPIRRVVLAIPPNPNTEPPGMLLRYNKFVNAGEHENNIFLAQKSQPQRRQSYTEEEPNEFSSVRCSVELRALCGKNFAFRIVRQQTRTASLR